MFSIGISNNFSLAVVDLYLLDKKYPKQLSQVQSSSFVWHTTGQCHTPPAVLKERGQEPGPKVV